MAVDPRQLEKCALETDIRALLGLDRDEDEYGAQVGEVASLSRWYRGFGLLCVGALTHLQESGPPAREAQCYLLLLLGSILFVDKSKDRVSAVVNLFVKRPDMLGEYAWGAGALAYLYRELGIASRAEAKGVAGCLTLLQCWIYDHFPTLRPSRLEPRELEQGQAGAFRWRGTAPRSSKKRDAQMLAYYRQAIDSLTPQSVCWTPYGQSPHLTVRRTLYQDLLRFAEIVEPYDPTRCLRQLGYVQSVSYPPKRPLVVRRPASTLGYSLSYQSVYDSWWNNLGAHSVHLDLYSTPIRCRPWEFAEDYMGLYIRHSHRY
ncbi:unnamed protein product [Linum tenue]|uniref:Aminotransferase-like plant mobile domain-containing protein n=2 Tax=Linum tenue TaxID=586396 RepID=A0AAV0RRL3_9ROSI|nr:unnamed protein product [Linum tenue]